MRALRAAAGAAVVVGLVTGALVSPGAAALAAPPAVVTSAADPEGSRARVLTDDYVVPGARPELLQRIRTWPGRTIRYRETIPSKWDWSLARAIEHWNGAGSGIRFVKAASARRARLTIGYGETGGADGVATLGYTPHAYVHLAPTYKRADPYDATTRVWVGRLFSHELGHVLGFDHTTATCSLMVPIFYMDRCPLLDDQPGYYACRWIDRPLLTRFVARYGGTAKQPPTKCLIEALPPPLADVTIGGGGTEGPVTLGWRLAHRANPGTRVRIETWEAAACGGRPQGAEVATVDPAAGTWRDPGKGTGSWCYRLQVENRYGATSPAVVRAADRWAPVPAAPAISSVTWRPELREHRLTWNAPAGTRLAVMRNSDDPLDCPQAYDPDTADGAWNVSGDTWAVSGWTARECVVFFAVTQWGTVSAGTQAMLVVPAPTVTPSVGAISPDPDSDGAFRVDLGLPVAETYRLGTEVVAGACPAAPPAEASWFDAWELEPGRYQLYAEDLGANCLLVAAIDDFGQRGPVVAREFVWDPVE